MTAIGGESITESITESPALLGYEASRQEPPSGSVEFVDFPFTASETTQERINTLLSAVERHRPRIAVGPDIEGDVSLDRAVEVGDLLLDTGADHVVLVPKDVSPTEVPDRFRLGFPAADFGSGSGGFIYEWADRPESADGVHILGGSPTVQLNLAGYGLDVQSVDGSAVERGAKYHDVWTPEPPHWIDVGQSTDLYDRIRWSLKNVAWAFAEWTGEDHPAVPSPADESFLAEVLATEMKESERAENELRRRERGRGPPIADPHSGETTDEAEALIEAAEEFNEADRERIEELRETVEQQEAERNAEESNA